MADYLDNGLLASIKALEDVILPAVDATNPLAREQGKLVARYLDFVRQRLACHAQRDHFELDHYAALAVQLRPHAIEAGVGDLIDEAISAANAAMRAHEAALTRDAIDKLTAAQSVLVRTVAAGDPALRTAVERLVITGSAALMDVQRAYYLPLGFEPDPRLVPQLSTAFEAKP